MCGSKKKARIFGRTVHCWNQKFHYTDMSSIGFVEALPVVNFVDRATRLRFTCSAFDIIFFNEY